MELHGDLADPDEVRTSAQAASCLKEGEATDGDRKGISVRIFDKKGAETPSMTGYLFRLVRVPPGRLAVYARLSFRGVRPGQERCAATGHLRRLSKWVRARLPETR